MPGESSRPSMLTSWLLSPTKTDARRLLLWSRRLRDCGIHAWMKNVLSSGALLSIFVVVAACRGSQAGGPEAPASNTATVTGGGGSAPSRKYASCAPASVPQQVACPARVTPPSNASSDYGCKTDAECTNGRDGRCVKNESGAYHGLAPSPEARRSNLLAGPMPPPPKTLCVYDKCQTDKDCGSGMRCACGDGKGQSRNQCVAVDTCLSDKDCGADALCACGTAPLPNSCRPGNCRTDSECGAGFACEQYCRSARDACRKDADCTAPFGMYPTCTYLPETKAFGCRAVHPPPAG